MQLQFHVYKLSLPQLHSIYQLPQNAELKRQLFYPARTNGTANKQI